jgi:hypothetical protein
VISRGPSDAVLLEAWLGAGFALRSLKRHVEEEAAFGEAVRCAGAGTEQGSSAAYQIAWAQYFRGDPAAGRATMEALASTPGAPGRLAGHALLYVGTWSLELEDAAGARRAFERILADHGESIVPESQWLAGEARKRLEALDGARR